MAVTTTPNPNPNPNLNQAWTWHGCADNERIDELIASLVSPALLWAAEDKAAASAPEAAELAAPTYVLLDGTWQEAEEVFSLVREG